MDDGRPDPAIGLADDHPLVRAALRTALRELGPGTRFHEATGIDETLALVAAHPELDLLLMDLHMPGVRGADGVARVREQAPALPIAVISAEERSDAIAELFALGVAAFIPKSDPEAVIVNAARIVLAGGSYVPPRFLQGASASAADGGSGVPALTQRQRDVLRLLARGLPNKLIARELGLTEGTVKVHLFAVFRALGVRNRTEAVLAAQRSGLDAVSDAAG